MFRPTSFRIVLFSIAVSILVAVSVFPKLTFQNHQNQKGNVLYISFTILNANPRTTEEKATSILENSFSTMEEIESISSRSYSDRGLITIRFKKGSNMSKKQFEANSIVRRIYPQLPSQVGYPTINIQAKENQRIIHNYPQLIYTIYGLNNKLGIKEKIQRELIQKIQLESGIENVTLSEDTRKSIVINYDNSLCKIFGIDPQKISDALYKTFEVWHGGIIRNNENNQFFLQTSAKNISLDDLYNLVVYNNNAQAIQLSKFTKIVAQEEPPLELFRVNGVNALKLSVFLSETDKSLQKQTEIKNKILSLGQKLALDLSIQLDYDSNEFLVAETLKNTNRAIISISVLLIFTLLAYRKAKHLMILVSSLFVTMSLAAAFSYLFNIPIHLYSLAGLSIGLSLVIENAIVVLDFYEKRQTKRALTALLGSTLTTATSLLLVSLLPENEEFNLLDFVFIISTCLFASLITSIFFTPACCNIVFDSKTEPNTTALKSKNSRLKKWYEASIVRLAIHRKLFLSIILILFGLPLFLLPENLSNQNLFGKIYNETIGSDFYKSNCRPYIDKFLGGALYQFKKNVFENSGYQNVERAKLYIRAQLPFGHQVMHMNQLMLQTEFYLNKIDGIEKFMTNVYSGQEASIEVYFTPEAENKGLQYTLRQNLIAMASIWGGAEWDIYGVGRSFNNNNSANFSSYKLKISGFDYNETEKIATSISNALKNYPSVKNIDPDDNIELNEKKNREYALVMDSKILFNLGIPTFTVAERIKSNISNLSNSIYLPSKQIMTSIKVESNEVGNYSLHKLLNEKVTLDNDKAVQMSGISRLEVFEPAKSIVRENRSYVRIISFEYAGSKTQGNKFITRFVNEKYAMLKPGYKLTEYRNIWDPYSNVKQYGLLLLSLVLIACICAIIFESIKQAVIIIFMIPVSYIGLIYTFSLGDFYFDQGGYGSFILLTGLVVNSAIYIINDFNHLKKQNPDQSVNKLIINASTERVQTILLTSLSTLAGLIPFLLSGQKEVFWFCFAIGMTGGIIFSTIAVLWILPVLLWEKQSQKPITII